MPRIRDISGMRFGMLLVVGENKVINGRQHWLCQCDCGNRKFVCAKYMLDGDTNSCGCLVRGKFGEASRNRVIREYKLNAKRRNISFELSDNEFLTLASKDCSYCGAPPSNCQKNMWNNGDFIYSGIDRADNTQGYTYDNCVSCCKTCNVAKNDMHHDVFMNWIKRVYEYNRSALDL